jgi:sugar lactone lactonase YvrE
VPTDVELGPDGAFHVTSLPGGPGLPGTGSVWRVDPSSGATTQVAGGLSSAVDLAIADDGTMFVAELFDGRVSKIVGGAPVPYLAIDGPTAVEFGPDGVMYVATGVVAPGAVYTVTP